MKVNLNNMYQLWVGEYTSIIRIINVNDVRFYIKYFYVFTKADGTSAIVVCCGPRSLYKFIEGAKWLS